MNKLIIVLPTLGYDAAQTDATTFVLQSQLDATAFKHLFIQAIEHFIEGYQPLYKGIALMDTDSIVSNENNPEAMEKLAEFERTYQLAEAFEQAHFLFEHEGQFIDMRQFTQNKEFLEEFEVFMLEDWVNEKLQALTRKPEFFPY